MPNYATTTALQTLMIGTTFDALTTSLAGLCITWAQSEVDKYLSKRYDLTQAAFQTTSSIPPMIRMLTEKLAQGNLWKQNSRGSKESITRGNELIKDAKENLVDIRDYKVDLVNTAGSVIEDFSNTAYQVRSNTDGYSTTFNEDDPESWAVDSDKLDDIEDDERD